LTLLLEVAAALLLGATLLWIVLEPVFAPEGWRAPDQDVEPAELEATPHGAALIALRDLELDHATGKLSDADYQELKARYTVAAVASLREAGGAEALAGTPIAAAAAPSGPPACPTCGPRPERDAVFCSACGRRMAA
jgi:hypothetical protein